MAYFMIAIMFPITAVGSTVTLFWMKGGFTGIETKSDTFKDYIFYYMVAKTALSGLCAVLSALIFDDEKALPHSALMHEESRRLGFFTQIKLLMTNKLYFLFVYGPLVSISLLGATDNHLGSLLVPFGITDVNFFCSKCSKFQIQK